MMMAKLCFLALRSFAAKSRMMGLWRMAETAGHHKAPRKAALPILEMWGCVKAEEKSPTKATLESPIFAT